MLSNEEKELFTPEYKNHTTIFVHELDMSFVIVHHHVAGCCQNTIYQKCSYVEPLLTLVGSRRNLYHNWDLCQN